MEHENAPRKYPRFLLSASLTISVVAVTMSSLALHMSLRDIIAPAPTSEEVRAAILARPSMLIEAGQALQAAQEETDRQTSLTLVSAIEPELFGNKDVPFLGNPTGKHVVVEFFDYQCEYCRAAVVHLHDAVKEDPELKILLREIVIIGEGSIPASLAALAARSQGKYTQVHDVLMQLPMPFTRESVIEAVSKVPGIDMERLVADMATPAINKAFEENVSLSRRVGVSATPSFVVAGAGLQKGFKDIARLRAFMAKAASKLTTPVSEP